MVKLSRLKKKRMTFLWELFILVILLVSKCITNTTTITAIL